MVSVGGGDVVGLDVGRDLGRPAGQGVQSWGARRRKLEAVAALLPAGVDGTGTGRRGGGDRFAVEWCTAAEHERDRVGRGRQELFRNQVPARLTELANRARIASITASSALEGVVVEDQARAAAIIGGKVTTLRTRSEQELAGYRATLNYLFGSDWRPLNIGLLPHLHRNLFEQTKVDGVRFKDRDNLVVVRSSHGSVAVWLVPVSAASTEYFTIELLDRYNDALTEGRHHPVLLVGLFVLDLLTIHPFADGNGRVGRALTNALLDDAGYTVASTTLSSSFSPSRQTATTRLSWPPPTAGTSRPTTHGPGWHTSPRSSRGPTRGSSSGPRPTSRRGGAEPRS